MSAQPCTHASSAMARLTRHHAISPTRTRSRLYRDWRARRRTCSRCSCYLTWHVRQETVVQTGSLASACALGRSKSAISKAPVNQAPLTTRPQQQPPARRQLLACTRPATSAWHRECPCQLSHINRHAPVCRFRLLLHPFPTLAAQLQPKSSPVILTRRGSTDKT
jgi:hypothetical protein